jgi:hypothetical protein
MGFRSFIIKHTVHLNTFNSFGHRTVESHVIHFPAIKSLPEIIAALAVGFSAVLRAATGEILSSSVDSNPPFPVASPCFFFRPENRVGKGWLIDRPWLDTRGLLEGDEGPANVGMPYAFSSMSASVSLVIPSLGCAGDAAPGAEDLKSLRELEGSNLLDQGAIAVLSIDGGFL